MRHLLPSVLLIVLVGCGAPKLNDEKKFVDVDFAGKTYDLNAVKVEQKITVEATSDEPIDVYVFLSKDKTTVERAVLANKQDGVIAGKEKEKNIVLQGTIPANEEWHVLLKASGFKKASGTVKIKNF